MNKIILIVLILINFIMLDAKQKLVIALEDEESYPSFIGSGIYLDAEKPGISVEIINIMAPAIITGKRKTNNDISGP